MDHEKCYVFSGERSTKRRRIEPSGLDSSWLLREKIYRQLWREQLEHIDEVLENANKVTLDELTGFTQTAQEDRSGQRLPCGLILAGPSIAAHTTLFEQLAERISDETSTSFALVTSTDAPNLKTILKATIKSATARKSVDDDEMDLVSASRKGPKLLNYDLQLLHDWVEESGVKQVVVSFRDIEAFDSNVLSETIEQLGIWSDRIPFVLFFGIATSVENLQERLSQSSIRYLDGRQFDVVQADDILEDIFFATTASRAAPLRLGAQLSHMLLERHREHLQSVRDFAAALQYAYMAHFYANPLSVFLSKTLKLGDLNGDHFEALRNVPSFQNYVEDSLAGPGKASIIRALLNADTALFDFTLAKLNETQSALSSMGTAVLVVTACQAHISKTSAPPPSGLFIKALAGQLAESPVVRELLLSIQRTPSDVLQKILSTIFPYLLDEDSSTILSFQRNLDSLLSKEGGTERPLRSEHDLRNDTVRTTVVAQKVQLSRSKSHQSEKDVAYSKIVSEFHGWLKSYFEKNLVDPETLTFHELVVYEPRVPHRAAFTPKTRFSIERALFAPHDYLNCECCAEMGSEEEGEASLAPTQPATSLLYRLYLESGALISVADLWSAFSAIVGDEDDVDNEKEVMPLFERALAELKYLGLIKGTRKKTDHVAKAAWRGL
ncbi:Origin recognition complex subunit 3 [Venturia nashicola]|uniref:Origin recognition complex subunit 3 n=1 Tax=Venturia nashicola TaxID=86259 RepID=A0A4Z1P7Y0_9PEZI|nr:Origin recognition complex subunit 3 [Venturia nashicola]